MTLLLRMLFSHGINLLPYTGAGSGIIRALQFTPDIQFENNETLREFVITLKREPISMTDDRVQDNDRDDRDRRVEEVEDNYLDTSKIESSLSQKKNEDRVEVVEVRIPYKRLSGVQKDIIQFCNIPRSAKEIMKHIGYFNNSKNMLNIVKPLVLMHYLELTEPEKPRSKNQKYRKVR